jgi:hypothetical protein
MWLIYVALLIVFIFVLDRALLDKRLFELAEQFNGPLRLPLIGTAYAFFGVGPKGENYLRNSPIRLFLVALSSRSKS